MSVMIGLFGMLCVVDMFALIVLPETKDKEMPDTIEEANKQFSSA